jgi:hypothetical protein
VVQRRADAEVQRRLAGRRLLDRPAKKRIVSSSSGSTAL